VRDGTAAQGGHAGRERRVGERPLGPLEVLPAGLQTMFAMAIATTTRTTATMPRGSQATMPLIIELTGFGPKTPSASWTTISISAKYTIFETMPVRSYLEFWSIRAVPARSDRRSEPTLRSTRSRTLLIIFAMNQPMTRTTRKPISFGTKVAIFDQASLSP
jgi:hypothetical protein